MGMSGCGCGYGGGKRASRCVDGGEGGMESKREHQNCDPNTRHTSIYTHSHASSVKICHNCAICTNIVQNAGARNAHIPSCISICISQVHIAREDSFQDASGGAVSG